MSLPAETNSDSDHVVVPHLASVRPVHPRRESDLAMTLYRIECYQYRTAVAIERLVEIVEQLKIPTWLRRHNKM